MLGLEREGVGEVRLEVGGALARNPVDEVERDVVESGITQSVHCASDVVRAGNALEHLEQRRPERLRAERDAVHAVLAEQRGELRRDGLRVRLDRQLAGLREGRRARVEAPPAR